MLEPVEVKDEVSGNTLTFQMWEEHCSFQMGDKILNLTIQQMAEAIVKVRNIFSEYQSSKIKEKEEAEKAEKKRKKNPLRVVKNKESKTTEKNETKDNGKKPGSKNK